MYGKTRPAVHGPYFMKKQQTNIHAENFANAHNGAVERYYELSIVTYTHDQHPAVCIWRRKLVRPFYHAWFMSVDDREKCINAKKACELREAEEKERFCEEQKRKREEALAKVKCGDIFVSIWGYDQTNADFYQVTGKSGSILDVRPIKTVITETGFMCGIATPIPGHFTGGPMKKRIGTGGEIMITSYSSASLWNRKPVNCSWYG